MAKMSSASGVPLLIKSMLTNCAAPVSRHITTISKPKAMLLLFWLTDEAWSLIERRALHQPISASYFAGVAIPLWFVWMTFCAIGTQLGSALGDTTRYGLDFAFAAMFIAVLAGFWKGTRTALVLADRKSTRLNSSHLDLSRMPSSA